MTTIHFSVPGKPQGKARARVFYNKNIGRVQAITPDNTLNYENLIKVMFLNQKPANFKLITDPCSVYVTALFQKAKSNKMIEPTIKPDSDNIIKCVLDAMNGIVYKDDKQVTEVKLTKQWTLPEQDEQLLITVICNQTSN